MTQVQADDRRALYDVTNPAGQDTFDIDFPLASGDDLQVFVDGILVDPEDYAVDLEAMTVVLDTAAEQDSTVALEGRSALARENGYPLRGNLRSDLLNDDINNIYYALQELRRDGDRALQLDRSVPDDVDPSIPAPEPSKVLIGKADGSGFENGPVVTDVETVAEFIDQIDTVADNIASVNTLAADLDGANTIGDVAAAITNVNLVGNSIAAVNSVSAALANINSVSAALANIATVAGIAAAITVVSGIAAAVSSVSAIAANVTTVAGVSANVTTVAGISANVTTVAGISGNVTTVAGMSANITSVLAMAANITSVLGISANIATVAGISANVTTVAGMAADIAAVIADASDIGVVAANIADINSVADVLSGSAALTSIAGLTTAADLMIYTTASNTYATTALTAAARTVLDDTTVGAMLTTIGGQAAHANLTAFAGLSLVADRLPYANGTGTLSLATFTAAARSIMDDTTVGAILTTIGGQPLDTELTALASITSAANTVPVFTGSGTASGIALAASQLLGRGASGNVTAITLGTGLSMSGTTLSATGGSGLTAVGASPFTPSGPTLSVSSISGGNDLVIEISGISASAAARCLLIKPEIGGVTTGTTISRWASDSAASPAETAVTGKNSISPSDTTIDMAAASTVSGKFTIKDYASTTGWKIFEGYLEVSTAITGEMQFFRGIIRDTGAITGLLFEWGNGSTEVGQAATNFDAGTIRVSTRI